MNIRELSSALLSLCRTAIRGDKLDLSGVSLPHLQSMTYRHGLDGSFYYILHDAVKNEEELEEFSKAHQRLRLVTIKQDGMRAQLLSLFEERQIHAMPLKGDQIRQFYPEDFCRPSSRINILVEKEKLALVEEIMKGEGFEEIERDENRISYRKSTYIIVSIHTSLAKSDRPFHAYFDELLMRSPLSEGKEYIHAITPADAYVCLLEYAYENLIELGASIRLIIDLGIFAERFEELLLHREVRAVLQKLKLSRFAEVMYQLYRAWMDNTALNGSLGLLSDLILAKGFYGTFENYLDATYERKSTLRAIFLPFHHMRIAEPWCVSPLLYPFAVFGRAYRVLFRQKDRRDETALPHLARGLTERERYAIWRSVGVRI
ncbi:MAG: nucleotidyltransferase family protein [Clostridia bacterium]|nr:nucleotidyltransferase family protein [Clostridia bacterium]